MSNLLSLVQYRTAQALNLTPEQLEQLIHANHEILHDPFQYADMDKLVDELHKYAQYQSDHPESLLIVDTDYDTDGIMSAAVLTAALDVFNINFRVYVPTMANGYGLSAKAVDEMKAQYNTKGYHIDMILTADNGTNAILGVQAARDDGIKVLVTDHHLGGNEYANANVIVNPNRTLPNGEIEPYPYKGNAGAAVAWKAMLAYAMKYIPDKLKYIQDLIVFAGIADVSDVMPITDENHYMVKRAVDELSRLTALRYQYQDDPEHVYSAIKNTHYIHYNTVFYGLYDMVALLQASKDEKRAKRHKNPISLPSNEELISWYLSPMMNAPRRIHATSKEAMFALMAPQYFQRNQNINQMIAMNEAKSNMRNRVTDEIDWEEMRKHAGNVLLVNAQHGIAGLVAGQITSKTELASMVFAIPTEDDVAIYDYHYFDNRFDADELVISASARSTMLQPLNVIMAKINEIRPDIIVGGGGHAQAAGYSIRYRALSDFAILFDKVAQQVGQEMVAQLEAQATDEAVLRNVIRLTVNSEASTDDYAVYNVKANQDHFVNDMHAVYDYENDLRPFGKDFEAQTIFQVELDAKALKDPHFNLNLGFWKTFKFNLYGVEVLTFDVELADQVKAWLQNPIQPTMVFKAKLEMNEFRGNVTPQLQLFQ